MPEEFIKIRKVESLPVTVRNELKDRGIISGLVEITVKENSPKEVTKIEQSLKLFSQKLEETALSG